MGGTDGSTGQAWALFYLEHRQALTAYALSLTGNAHDAEDLIQEVLVNIVRQDRPVRSAKPYVLRSMRNLACDHGRANRARPRAATLDGVEVACVDAMLDDPSRRELAHAVRQALVSLEPAAVEVIVLKVYCDLTFQDIAAVLDRPMGTVTSHYARGLAKLRTVLEQELNYA